jgi:hypothetical protein
MTFDLHDVLDSAKADAPPPRRSVEDIVTAGQSLQRRRRYTWMTGGVAAVAALAVATAVSLPHLAGADTGSDATAGTTADAGPLKFPTLNAPFMYSIKGYSIGALHVSDPVFATASYQEAIVTIDGVAKTKVVNSAGTWERSYDRSVATLTVYRPGVFKTDKFKAGASVQVRGLPGLLTEFDAQVSDEAGAPAAGANGKPTPTSMHTVKVPALAWQYADDAWATLVTNPSFKTTAPAKDLQSLASGLTPAEPTSVKVPYRFGNVPAGYHLVGIGTFEPTSGGMNVSAAYFSKSDVPVTGLTDRLTELELAEGRGDHLKIIIDETAPAAPSDPFPHPNPKRPCQDGFCDRAINDNYFVEVSQSRANMPLIQSVTAGLVFDNPADRTTWHDVTTFGAPK